MHLAGLTCYLRYVLTVTLWDFTSLPACRFTLAKKRSGDVVGGTVCLGFELLSALEYAKVWRHQERCA